MNEWYFLLTPVSVLAVLLLFRFIGCASILGLDDVQYVQKPGPPAVAEPDYPQTVMDEKDPANNPVLISYWRLQERSSTTPVPGGTAKDEQGLNHGTYKIVTLPASTPDHSPATAQPAGTLSLEAQGLLEYEPSSTSAEVHGGYIEVAPTLTLNIPQFTAEALVFPMWDQSQPNFGRYYSVIESSGPLGPGPKKLGFAIYAGPQDPQHLQTPYRWQVWLGDGTQFKQITSSSRPPALIEFNKTNYLAVTYDGTTLRLYTFFTGKNVDDVLSVQEPFSPYSPNAGTGVPLFIGMGLGLFPPFPATIQQRYPFHGRIEEVAMYKMALSTGRITSHIGAAFKNL
jgi:hypothetical protein